MYGVISSVVICRAYCNIFLCITQLDPLSTLEREVKQNPPNSYQCTNFNVHPVFEGILPWLGAGIYRYTQNTSKHVNLRLGMFPPCHNLFCEVLRKSQLIEEATVNHLIGYFHLSSMDSMSSTLNLVWSRQYVYVYIHEDVSKQSPTARYLWSMVRFEVRLWTSGEDHNAGGTHLSRARAGRHGRQESVLCGAGSCWVWFDKGYRRSALSKLYGGCCIFC